MNTGESYLTQHISEYLDFNYPKQLKCGNFDTYMKHFYQAVILEVISSKSINYFLIRSWCKVRKVTFENFRKIFKNHENFQKSEKSKFFAFSIFSLNFLWFSKISKCFGFFGFLKIFIIFEKFSEIFQSEFSNFTSRSN